MIGLRMPRVVQKNLIELWLVVLLLLFGNTNGVWAIVLSDREQSHIVQPGEPTPSRFRPYNVVLGNGESG